MGARHLAQRRGEAKVNLTRAQALHLIREQERMWLQARVRRAPLQLSVHGFTEQEESGRVCAQILEYSIVWNKTRRSMVFRFTPEQADEQGGAIIAGRSGLAWRNFLAACRRIMKAEPRCTSSF